VNFANKSLQKCAFFLEFMLLISASLNERRRFLFKRWGVVITKKGKKRRFWGLKGDFWGWNCHSFVKKCILLVGSVFFFYIPVRLLL